MLNSMALEFIIDRVYLGIHNYAELSMPDFDEENCLSLHSSVLKLILFALIATEKFSHTSESKDVLLQSLTIRNERPMMNILEYYEPWAFSSNCLKRQIGETTLTNVCAKENMSKFLFKFLRPVALR